MPANAHKVLFSQVPDQESFHAEIQVPEAVADSLRGARDAIRTAIADAVGNWNTLIESKQLFVIETAQDRRVSRPRFRMQGSFAYAAATLLGQCRSKLMSACFERPWSIATPSLGFSTT